MVMVCGSDVAVSETVSPPGRAAHVSGPTPSESFSSFLGGCGVRRVVYASDARLPVSRSNLAANSSSTPASAEGGNGGPRSWSSSAVRSEHRAQRLGLDNAPNEASLGGAWRR